MLILTVVTGPDKGAVFRLAGDRAHRIGRRHGSVPLNDKGVSSRHAEIALVNGLWTVSDAGSSNGTFVNQHRIAEPTVVEDGDRIQIGRTMLVFNSVDDAELAHHDDDPHEPDSHAHATLHAALAAQERNQQLLTEVRDLLAARTGESLDERTRTGETSDSGAVSREDVADLVRQVLERIDQIKPAPPAPPAKPEPDPRLDDVLDQLRAMGKREHVVAPPPPAPPVDLKPVLDELAKLRDTSQKATTTQAPPVDLKPVLDAIGALRETHSKAAEPAKLDFSPVLAAIDTLRASQPKPAEPAKVDLAPVLAELTKLREAMPKPTELAAPAPPVDLKPVLDAIESLRAAQPKPGEPATLDLSPVLAELAQLREAMPKPTEPAAPAPPVDLKPVLDAIESLRASQSKSAEPAKLDLSPVLDELTQLRESMPKPTEPAAPAPPIDLKPVLDAIDALRLSQPKPVDPPKLDLSPVLEAIAQRPDTSELKATLSELLKAAQPPDESASAASAVVRNAMPAAIAELRKTIDALPAKLDPSAAIHRVLDRIDAAANPQHLADLRTQVEELADRLDRGDELKRLSDAVESIHARLAEPPPPPPAPIDPTPKLDALHEAVAGLRDRLDAAATAKPDEPASDERFASLRDRLDALHTAVEAAKPAPAVDPTPAIESLRESLAADRTADLREKLDQLIDIATAPSSPVAATPQPDPAVSAKLDELRDAVAALADRKAESPVASTDDDLARRILDRLDALAAREPASAGPTADVSSIEHKLDAVIDVLAAMPQATGEAAATPDIADAAFADLSAKLEVIYEALQSRPTVVAAASGGGGATSDEIDTLINLVQSESTQANAEAALNKVLAKLDAMAAPTPSLDHELLERLELAARKLEKLPDIDLGPALAISDQIEPMMRRVHEHVLAAEPVDLTAFERRVAELTETVRDSINHSDRPLLEQILVEMRKPAEAPDADKIELILERVGRLQDTRELEPLVRQMHESLNVAGNEKIVALLRQLIEHVQKMPGKFDGRDTLGNIFESLRRLEQQQDQQGAAIRKLIAAVADAESSLAAASHPPAQPHIHVESGRSLLAAPALTPAAARSDADTDAAIEQMIAGADPAAGRGRRRSLWLTLLLVIAVPLAVVGVVVMYNEINRGSDLLRQIKSPAQPSDSGNRPAPLPPAESADSSVTRR